jgi:hypothetical protein
MSTERKHAYNLIALAYGPQSHLNPMRPFRFFFFPVPDHEMTVHIVLILVFIVSAILVRGSITISNRDIIREIHCIV